MAKSVCHPKGDDTKDVLQHSKSKAWTFLETLIHKLAIAYRTSLTGVFLVREK